eukprot:COSAG04_NODE_542_length_12865_cov_44.119693_12_plen_84_part_00
MHNTILLPRKNISTSARAIKAEQQTSLLHRASTSAGWRKSEVGRKWEKILYLSLLCLFNMQVRVDLSCEYQDIDADGPDPDGR